MIRLNLNNRPSLIGAAAFFILSFLAAQSIFHGQNASLEARIRQKSSEYAVMKGLLSKKDTLRADYSKLGASSRIGSAADWVRYITDMARQERINLESIYPKSTQLQTHNGEFKYALKFRTSAEAFGAFVYTLALKDPLSKIDGILLSKTSDGALNCELTLSRILPK
jgi:hypothetical protein